MTPSRYRCWGFALVWACAVAFVPPASAADSTNEEDQLIRVLQSNASLHDKDAACARLKRIGTVRSVPALAALLPDSELSHSARYALESMPFPKAGSALIEAVEQTKGETQVGIINSLGVRGETAAVSCLSRLLPGSATSPGSEAAVAAAAASALGQIGGQKTLSTLETALKGSSAGMVREAIADAILRCANGLLVENREQALIAFQNLYRADMQDYVRLAAYRGMIRGSGKDSLRLIAQALEGSDGPSQLAALQELREVRESGVTEACVGLLPKLGPPQQVALIDALAQRGDEAATPAIAPFTKNRVPEVRLSAINGLGVLGNASAVSALAEAAASSRGEEQAAARQALVLLRRGNPTEQLVNQFGSTQPQVQAELARALGERRDAAALPKLLELARAGSQSARQAALQALAALVSGPQLGLLVQLVQDLNDQDARTEAATALNTACQRLQSLQAKADLDPLARALANSAPPVRVALLPVCSGLVDPQVRRALQAASHDADPGVRTAAIRALCDTTDPELLNELLSVVSSESEESLRTLAIAACVRLTRDEAGVLSNPKRLVVLKALLQAPRLSVEQKRLVLSGLAEVPEPEALSLIEPMLEQEGVQTEAARAVIKVAGALPSARSTAEEALKTVLKAKIDAATRTEAEAMLKQVEANADYLTAWQVAGPYRQAGKDYAALFDIAFDPEKTDGRPQWKDLPAHTDPRRPWVMDLLKALSREQCVAYARTWVPSDQAQPVLLEIGSDDGMKVWLNNELVYSLNVARPLTPGSDKVKLSLKQGWNPLLVKVTQNNQGWEFCARLVKPDGTHLAGLTFESAPPK